MTTFTIGQPVTTRTPRVVVDAGLPAGTHRFQLVVVDSRGNVSQPAQAVVRIGRVIVAPAGPLTPPAPGTPTAPLPRAGRPRRGKT
ncbi:MAG TPA: hypothetical protein PKH69_02900 [Thiobacillaceae bacterium]|nr:hypothetical protein [Thiobacillaceae bacterium]HNU63035.1 hypothetical protein [Thiobacillaceae bacterium]